MNRCLWIVLVGLLLACETEVDHRPRLLESWGQTALELYVDFEQRAEVLHTETQAFCNAPSNTTLEAAQQAWWSAREPWKRAEIFAFGPYKLEPLRLGPKIDTWPVRVTSADAVLDGTYELTPELFLNLGSAQSGMPVIEYLLYEPRIDLVAEFSNTPRRCEYLVGLAGDLVLHAREMREAWDPEHGDYLGDLVSGAAMGSLHMNTTEIVERMVFTVENIRNDKLGKPVGDATGGDAQPDKTESSFSGRSLEDIRDNLKGVEALYQGDDGDEERVGLAFYLDARGHDFSAQAKSHFEASFAAIDAIPEPLTTAVLDSPEKVQEAIDVLAELQRFIQVDVANALSISIGFNDTDGD